MTNEIKYLDDEEKELIESYRDIDYNKLKTPTQAEQKQLKSYAKQFLKNDTKMNIRINSTELKILKDMADQEGLKYQTLIKNILRKHIAEHLSEKEKYAIK